MSRRKLMKQFSKSGVDFNLSADKKRLTTYEQVNDVTIIVDYHFNVFGFLVSREPCIMC